MKNDLGSNLDKLAQVNEFVAKDIFARREYKLKAFEIIAKDPNFDKLKKHWIREVEEFLDNLEEFSKKRETIRYFADALNVKERAIDKEMRKNTKETIEKCKKLLKQYGE